MTLRRPFACLSLALSALALSALACRPGNAPVGELLFDPAQLELGWPELVEVRIRFRAERELPADAARPIVFLHLLDEPGSVVRTFDHALPGDWVVGHELDYTVRLVQSALAEPLPAGDYLLSLGLYTPELGRVALRGAAEEGAKLEYGVATVRVPPAAPAGPRARFSESWLPLEPGADRQILARRSLAGGGVGTLQFGPLAGPGRIYLRVEIPDESRDVARVELAAGESQPRLRIASSCGGEQIEVTGSGGFDLDLAVPAAVPEGTASSCEIALEPNFQVRWRNRAEATSARLALLAWRPGAGDAPRP
jgi:hypothetical protein